MVEHALEFDSATLEEIARLAIECGLAEPEKREHLIPARGLRGSLPTKSEPNGQLRSDLRLLAGRRDESGELHALRTWLSQAAIDLHPRPEADQFRKWEGQLRGKPETLDAAIEGARDNWQQALFDGDEAASAYYKGAYDGLRRQKLFGRALERGDGLGRFRLRDRLGEGGFGEVWEAQDDQGSIVAIKILHPHLARDPVKLHRFEQGAKRLRALDHSGIVRVRDERREEDGYHFFTMDVVEGKSLSHLIEHGPLTAEQVPALIARVGEALACAHAKGLVHRDVHPGNILVRADGTITLIDFDLVHAPGTVRVTRSEVGLRYFAAPEKYQPEDPRADIFSLAMTTLSCCIGETPGYRHIRRLDAVVRDLDCSKAQRRAVARALSDEPDDNFETVMAFCRALVGGGERKKKKTDRSPYALDRNVPLCLTGPLNSSSWDGDDLARGLLRLPVGDWDLDRAMKSIWRWISPERSTNELAFAWYALEMVGYPPRREAFFNRCGRPLAAPATVLDESKWVTVPSGTFDMGSGRQGETPVRSVKITAFQVTKTLVTQREYGAFDAGHQPKHVKGEPLDAFSEHPVRRVTWWEAFLFARWVDARLLTEAEWEYACRAGSSEQYCFGNDHDQLRLYAWCKDNADGETHPVGQLRPNAFGLYDIHGLVFEWCADWYRPYPDVSEENPTGPAYGQKRVIRSSQFKSDRKTHRCSNRERSHPHTRHERGIRLARSLSSTPDLARATTRPVLNLQVALPFGTDPLIEDLSRDKPTPKIVRSTSVQPTPRQEVFDTYWYFAAERQHIFYRRLAGEDGPWTDDPILQKHKFCNAFRAADRVSQYLIREVIYGDGLSKNAEDVVFRTLLFRLFNKSETWPVFCAAAGGEPRWANFDLGRYGRALDNEMDAGNTIFGNAYMIAPPRGEQYSRKHEGYLDLIRLMFADGFVAKLKATKSFRDVYQLLLGYPMVGKFIAYQLATDLNYTEVINFDENSFTQAGPGAERGITKCFEDRGGMSSKDIIDWMVGRQEIELGRLGINPKSAWLWGRPLKAIDCQNLFCETDKYCRVGFPEITSNRKRIKQKFSVTPGRRIRYVFPPKWTEIGDTSAPPVPIPPRGELVSPAPGGQPE